MTAADMLTLTVPSGDVMKELAKRRAQERRLSQDLFEARSELWQCHRALREQVSIVICWALFAFTVGLTVGLWVAR